MYALTRPDGSLRCTGPVAFDLAAFPGHRQYTVTGHLDGAVPVAWDLDHDAETATPVYAPAARYAADLAACHEARRAAYPPVGDQLDALFKARAGDGAALAAIDAAIAAVKAAHPKPAA